jgi:hypothetical protein
MCARVTSVPYLLSQMFARSCVSDVPTFHLKIAKDVEHAAITSPSPPDLHYALFEGYESSSSPSRPSDWISPAKPQSDESSPVEQPLQLPPPPSPGLAFQQPLAPEPSVSPRPTPELTLLPSVAPGELAPNSVVPRQAPATYAYVPVPEPSDTVPSVDAYGTDYFFATEDDAFEETVVGNADRNGFLM